MPGGDRTGPLGQGPRTGRAAGFCSGFGAPGFANTVRGGRGPGYRGPGFWGPGQGYGRGFGFGPGRGRGRGPGFWGPGRGRGFGPGRGRGPVMAYPEPVYPAYAYPTPYMSYYRPWW